MMRSLLLFCFCVPAGIEAFSQADSIYLHSGAVIGGNVRELLPNAVTYTTWQSALPKMVSRQSVQKIRFSASGRDSLISQARNVQTEWDWEQVAVLSDKSGTAGLTYAAELSANGGGKFVDSAQAMQQAMTRLKKDAARLRCPFVYITGVRMREAGYVGRQIRLKAVAYRY